MDRRTNMNPEHAKCFNELKELCKRYNLEMSTNADCEIFFTFKKSKTEYFTSTFHKTRKRVERVEGPFRTVDVDIPPSEKTL